MRNSMAFVAHLLQFGRVLRLFQRQRPSITAFLAFVDHPCAEAYERKYRRVAFRTEHLVRTFVFLIHKMRRPSEHLELCLARLDERLLQPVIEKFSGQLVRRDEVLLPGLVENYLLVRLD